tara:strand:+ start:1283 stop:2842 length:1560 start_codon:yes stop_codon:yes gene_type:complete
MVDEVDHRGEALPTLTKRSSSVDLNKLLKYHKPDFSSKKLSTFGFWPLARLMIRSGVNHQFSNVQCHIHESITSDGPGMLAVSWHTAGLIDPMLIVNFLDKPYAFAGRHDLLTGPIIGFWGRRMGVQPLLRQAERKRGKVDDETASRVNASSMLTVASKLANGHASVLMPEGHSHSEPHILRLRTGPIRSSLNAAHIAQILGKDPPVLVPVGLTFRDPHSWFSDVFVEYAAPLELPISLDKNHGNQLHSGDWVEPDETTTILVRNQLRDRLAPLTPDAPDWDTWNAWLLLAHLQAEKRGDYLVSWADEVLAARKIRDDLRNSTIGAWHGPEASGDIDPASTNEAVKSAKKVASRVEMLGLDGRACVNKPKPPLTSNLIISIILTPLMLASSPFALLANGIQWMIGHVLAKFNGEAVDKRTTYQSLPSTFGLFLFRPPIHVITIGLLWYLEYISNPIYFPLFFIGLWIISDISLKCCRIWLKHVVNVKIAIIRMRTKSSNSWKEVEKEINSLIPMLDALK